MGKIYTSLGLMSGTSGDGVDASIITSDGIDQYGEILNKYFEYDQKIHKNLHNLRGKILKIDDLKKNDFTLINFWASWCAPCKVEHPILMRLSKSKKLKILGVNFKDKDKQAKKFLSDLGNPYDFLAKDINGKQSVSLGIYGIPESILINNELLIMQKFVGPLSLDDYNKIEELIK